MKFYLLLAFLSVNVSLAYGQMSGRVNYEQLGIAFDIPPGWVGQENEEMILLGSNTVPGIIVITTHEYDKSQLIQEANAGINEEGGTTLKLAGQLENFSEHAIGGEFSGTMEWQPAKAYMIGMVNPHATGPGVSVMAITTAEQYNTIYKDLCKEIYQSIQFKKIDRSSELTEWKEWLSNARLTYMDSYYSGSSTAGGVSGGYDTKKTIDLCGKGYFNYSGSSNISVGSNSSSGYSYANKSGHGTWEIQGSASGTFWLVLRYYSGDQVKYEMIYMENKFFLDGTRYFVTSEGEYAPNCN